MTDATTTTAKETDMTDATTTTAKETDMTDATTTTAKETEIDINYIMTVSRQMIPGGVQQRIADIANRYSDNFAFVEKLLTLLALDISRKVIQQSLLDDLYKRFGYLPKDCGKLIEMLQDMGVWPLTFPSPLGIYNKLLEKKKGSSDTHWWEKNGFVGHNKKSQTVEKEIFYAVLNICRNLSKEKSLKEIEQRERKKDVMKIARNILDAALRGDRDEIELLLLSFEEAKQKAENVLVEYTDAEESTIETIDRRLFQVKTRKKDSVEQLEKRAEAAEAAEAAAKEAAEAAAKEAAEAKREAAEAAAKAAEAAAKAEEDRENLRKQNAERIIQYTQQAEKFRLLQEIMKDCPEDLNKASKKQLYEMLTRLRKAIA